MKKILFIFLILLIINGWAFQITGDQKNWRLSDLVGFDKIGDSQSDTGDIASVYLKTEGKKTFIRLTFDNMITRKDNKMISDNFLGKNLILSISITRGHKRKLLSERLDISQLTSNSKKYNLLRTPIHNLLEISFPQKITIAKRKLHISIQIYENNKMIEEFQSNCSRNYRGGNCAFVHHGNQGLTYTEVFYGQFPQETSGYDEVLEVHQLYGLPGNFHMSGTLMPAAEWHNPEFNDWLASGVQDGYVAMLTSALGQHIMPFVQNEMNDWSVATEFDMVQYFYDYTPKVAWVPERVWLAPDHYPAAGVTDWLGDNWRQHGVEAVILDDAPHCDSGSNSKIHWMNNGSGIDLRVIPINNTFVGNMQYDAQAAKNQINSTGQDDIIVYGTDWEVAAEMNEHHDQFFLDNYQDVLGYCSDNYPGINVWKLDSAINNPDFNGSDIEITTGTYFLLGGYDGYGGGNNSWYTDWAGHNSQSDFHATPWNYGYIWNNAYENLMSSPNNSLSQLGWYTLMINLHETGWHDNGEISGWENRYSSHMKNSNVYAEASHWANGEYTQAQATYFSDIDRDGIDELVMYNDNVMYVFESVGGRISWAFAKNENGSMYSLIGSDVAYYSETDGDYNESSNNHVGGLSETSPNYQHEIYDMEIVNSDENELLVRFSKNNVVKECKLHPHKKYLEITYANADGDIYTKSGWTADLLDIIWSGKSHLQRMWGEFGSYCGRRNSSSGATAAWILGEGGASHNSEFEGTLVMGDEIHGNGTFKVYLYTGYTSAPYDANGNRVVELDEIATILGDDIAPSIVNNKAWLAENDKIQIVFDENIDGSSAENISNYNLNGCSQTTEITDIVLSHRRKVTLFLNEEINSATGCSIIVNNVTDLNGNTISANSEATLTEMIKPHLVGNFNNWNPANHNFDLILQDNGIWEGTFSLNSGLNEYKVLETNDWDQSFPVENQSFELESDENITFYANCGVLPEERNGDEFIFHSPNPPLVTGNFLSQLGGTDWDVQTQISIMNDDGINGDIQANDAIYTYATESNIIPDNYEYKIVLNNNWDQNTSEENLHIDTNPDGIGFIIYYDMSQNFISSESLTVFADDESLPKLNICKINNVFPNPFNPETTVSFNLSVPVKDLVFSVYNIKGQKIVTKNMDFFTSGTHTLTWDGKDNNGVISASGLYFIRLSGSGFNSITKSLMLK